MSHYTPGKFKGLISELKSNLKWADWAKNEKRHEDNEDFLKLANEVEKRILDRYAELFEEYTKLYESQTIKTDQERQ